LSEVLELKSEHTKKGETWWSLEYLKHFNLSEGIPGYGSCTRLYIYMCMKMCMIACLSECLCWVKSSGFSRFWKFSRIRLAGLQSRKAAHTFLYYSRFLEKE